MANIKLGSKIFNGVNQVKLDTVDGGIILFEEKNDIPIVGDGSAAVAHYQLDLSTIYPTGTAPYTLTLTCGDNTLTGTYASTADKFVYALPTTGTWQGNLVDSSSEVNIDFSFDIAPYVHKKSIREGGSRVLADDSWETISEISKSGNPEMYYNIGDTKDVTLTTGEVITLQIIGFNHDVLSDGSGYAGITFQMKNLLATTYKINNSNTNVGGWESSVVRTRLQTDGDIYKTIPDDIKAVIRPVDKITSVGNKSTNLKVSSDYAFLLSEIEIFGTASYSVAGEGKRYDYYASYANANARRIKYLSNGSGSASYWWTRSPSIKYNGDHCFVDSIGSINFYGASNSNGISLAFCV